MGKPTIYDVAGRAGVSSATVNRALSGKGRVSEQTRERIEAIAKEMGYHPSRIAGRLAGREIRIAVVYPGFLPEFYGDIARGAARAKEELSEYNVSVDCLCLEGMTLAAERDFVTRIVEAGYHGAVVAPMYSESSRNDRFVSSLREAGVAVGAVVSEARVDGVFCVRYDGYTAGRMAAQLLHWRLGDGARVAIATGDRGGGIHEQILSGFESMLGVCPLSLVAVYENKDDPQLAYYTTEAMLRSHPDLQGLYVSSANSSSVCRRVIEMGYAGRLAVVASDLFPELRRHIENGVAQATIFQDQYMQTRICVKALFKRIALGEEPPKLRLVMPQLITQANLESFLQYVDFDNRQPDRREEAEG